MPKRAARVDANQSEIVEKLRDAGCSVFVTSDVGQGFGDILVGLRGQNYLLEIKDGDKPPSQRKLTPAEKRFSEDWRGQYGVVLDVADAFFEVGLINRQEWRRLKKDNARRE